MRTALSLAVALACVAALRADIAPNPLTTGGTNITLKDPAGGVPVTMAWEEVDVTPSAEKNRVEAVFLLKNTGKKDVELTVGFPSYFQVALEDFTAEVDGKKQAAEVRKTGGEGPKKIFTYWLCWPMKFAAGEEHKVRVTYWCKTEMAFDFFETKLPKDVRSEVCAYSSGYVLRTGAGWDGNIGKATIRLHYGDQVKKENVTIQQPEKGWKYDKKADVDELVLTDFKPEAGELSTSDVVYRFKLHGPEEEAKVLFAALKDKRLDPWAIDRLLKAVEKDNVLRLDADARKAKAFEILELMVPPKGPKPLIQGPNDEPDNKYLEYGAEMLLHDAFARLLAHYREEKDAASAEALTREFAALLKVVTARRDKEFFKDPRFQRGAQWEEQKKLKKECEELIKSLPPEK
jgi:hypothetical protein